MIIASVPHSGTMLVADIFRQQGFNQRGFTKPEDGKTMHVGHVISSNAVRYVRELAQEHPLIVPLRHPALTERSWILRKKPVDQMIQAYKNLISLEDLDPVYIRIDTVNRDKDLQRASERLDMVLTTEWPVINSKQNTYHLSVKDLNPSKEIMGIARHFNY